MTTLAICAALLLGSDCIETGWSSRYDPLPMSATIALRQEWEQLPQDLSMYDGFVAVADCDLIGREMWLRPSTQGAFERFLIVDCAGGRSTWQWMTDNNILVEVDYDTAERWGCLVESCKLVKVGP